MSLAKFHYSKFYSFIRSLNLSYSSIRNEQILSIYQQYPKKHHVASWLWQSNHKIMVICSHFHSGAGKVVTSSTGLWCSAFTYLTLVIFKPKKQYYFSYPIPPKRYSVGSDTSLYCLDRHGICFDELL